MTESAGLLDTSVFIAREVERSLRPLPDRVAVSLVTLGELRLGVLSAPDDSTRMRRANTLDLARTFEPVPITEAVMESWAQLVVDCRRTGIHRAVKRTDASIAATAITLGLPVVTQDDDFDRIASAHPSLRVERV